MKTAPLNDTELSAYCRELGLYPEQVKAWREACEQPNDWDQAQTKRLKETRKADEKRIEEDRQSNGHYYK